MACDISSLARHIDDRSGRDGPQVTVSVFRYLNDP